MQAVRVVSLWTTLLAGTNLENAITQIGLAFFVLVFLLILVLCGIVTPCIVVIPTIVRVVLGLVLLNIIMFSDLGHLATFQTEQQSCTLTYLEDCCLASLGLVEVCPEELAPAEVVTVESRCWTCFPLEEAATAAEIHWDIIGFVKCLLRNKWWKKAWRRLDGDGEEWNGN